MSNTIAERTSGDFAESLYVRFVRGHYSPEVRNPVLATEESTRQAMRRYTSPHGQEVNSKTVWDSLSWSNLNPAYGNADRRKPDWATVVLPALLAFEHSDRVAPGAPWEAGQNNDLLHRGAEEVAEAAVETQAGTILPPEPHALTAMAHLFAWRGEAGVGSREHTVRGSDGSLVKLRNRAELGDLVIGAALRADAANSAANTVRGLADGHLATLGDHSKTNIEREQALWNLRGIEEDYAGSVRSQVAALSFDSEPTDATGYRRHAIQEVETAAIRQRNAILGVEFAQGSFDDAACDEQGAAIRRVARLRQRANRRLYRAGSVGRMRAIRRKAIADIEAVVPAGVPKFAWVGVPASAGQAPGQTPITGGAHTAAFTYSPTATGPQAVITIRAAHSDDSESVETAFVEVVLAPGFTGILSVPTDSKTSHDLAIRYEGKETPTAGIIARLAARNDCGTANLTISI